MASGRWEPIDLPDAVALFRGAPFRWWVSGGMALEPYTGRTWREHDDIDIGVVRGDLPGLAAVLDGWDLWVAAAGAPEPWAGQALRVESHQYPSQPTPPKPGAATRRMSE